MYLRLCERYDRYFDEFTHNHKPFMDRRALKGVNSSVRADTQKYRIFSKLQSSVRALYWTCSKTLCNN